MFIDVYPLWTVAPTASSPPGAHVATQDGQLGPTVWPRLPEQRRGGSALAERGDDGKCREKVPGFAGKSHGTMGKWWFNGI